MGHLLEVGCLHGRVIWLDELVVDKLDDEGRLACTATTHQRGLGKEDKEGDKRGGLTDSSGAEHADFAFLHEITGSVARHGCSCRWLAAGWLLAAGWRG